MQPDKLSAEPVGLNMSGERNDSPPPRDPMDRSRSPHHQPGPITIDDEGYLLGDDDHPVTQAYWQHHRRRRNAQVHESPSRSPSPEPSTQEQDAALYYYARSLLRSEHERRHERVADGQELEIENLMFLLSRDSKEICEIVAGAMNGGEGEQEGGGRAVDGVNDGKEGDCGCDGGMVCPIGVAMLTSFIVVVLGSILLFIWLKQVDLTDGMKWDDD